MTGKISEETIAEVKNCFELFDKVGDGKIDATQAGDIIRSMGLNPTNATVNKVNGGVKHEGEQRLSFEEFLPMYQQIATGPSETGTKEDFMEGFKVFDKEGNGVINAAELRHVLITLGEKLTDLQVDQVMQGHENAAGEVHYEEFINYVMNNLDQ